MKCDICDNCIKKDVCSYRDNSEICGEYYHEFVADFNVLEQIRDEIDSHCSSNRDRNDGLYIAMKIIDKYIK